MKKNGFSLVPALLLSLASFGRAWAGPPFATDDPEPVEYGHWEVYLAGNLVQTPGGSSGTAPQIEVNYGALPGLQLHAIATLAFDSPVGAASRYGIGDTELGMKYRFLKEGDGFPEAGVFPLVEIPTGDASKGLGNGQAQFYLPLWLQKTWGPWQTYGGGGYWINPGPGNQNWVFLGWEVQRDLSPVLTLGGELFFRTPSQTGGQDSLGGNLGAILNLDGHDHPMLSLGRDITGSTDSLTGYFAYQWTF